MSLLSIIIPHHNTPDLLWRCLDSIPESKDVQVIVVDDNSDASIVDFGNLLDNKRSNVEIYLTKEGRGAGYARNVGLRYANGKWLLFADSDDFFTPDFYTAIYKWFESDADMVLFKANSVDSDTLELSDRSENINRRIDEYIEGKATAKEASIRVQSPWCRLIRREFVKQHNILFDEVMACNDTMFTTKCTCLAGKVDVSPDVIYVVTYRRGSLWDSRKKNPKNYLTRLDVQIRRNRYVKQYGYTPLPLMGYVKKAGNVSFQTFLKALWMVISRGALLQGISFYLRK